MTTRDLPSEVATHPGWGWMPGMGGRFASGEPFRASAGPKQTGQVDVDPSVMRPDLDDPGTQGCIAFSLLPKAWGPEWTVAIAGTYVAVRRWDKDDYLDEHRFGSTDSLGANLALALLAAPRPEGGPT